MKTASLRSARTWIIAALVASLSTGVALWSLRSGTASVISDPIKGLAITPSPASVEAGGTLRLTAEGDFGTTTMPVRADWFFLEPESEATGTLDGCQRSKTCDFHAGDRAGVAVVQAQVGDGDAVAVAKITVEESLKNPFKDALPSWAQPSILRLYRRGIVKGYEDGRYGSADSLTRGQIVTLIHRMLASVGLLQAGASCGRAPGDIAPSHYAYAAACAFGDRGWIEPKAAFRPDDTASRAETAGFLVSAVGSLLGKSAAPESAQVFEDIPVSSPFFRATALLKRVGIMTGYPNGDFGGSDPLNRAAAATVIERTLTAIGKDGVQTLPPPATPADNPAPTDRPASTDTADTSGEVFDWNNVDLPSRSVSPQRVTAIDPAWQWPEGWAESEGVCRKTPDPVRPATDAFLCCEACPATDITRFYIPFEGNDCEPGDVVRSDLTPKTCANPLIEMPADPDDLPETYGERCPRKTLPLLRGQLLQAQIVGADSEATEALCASWETKLQALEAELARAAEPLARTMAELKDVAAKEAIARTQLAAAQQRFASYLSRRASFKQNRKFLDANGYPIDASGQRIAQYVEAETMLQQHERALAFQAQRRASLEPIRARQEEAFNRLKAQRDDASNSLYECKRNLTNQRTRENMDAEGRRNAEENRIFAERARKAQDRETRGEVPPGLWLGRECCNGQAIREPLRSCRYVRIDDIEFAYLYPNTEVSIKNLENFRAYMEQVEKVNELLGGEAMTGMDLLIERITEFADLADIDVDIENPVSSDAVMGQALDFLKEFQKRNPLIGITVSASPIVVDYSRLWTAATPSEGGLCVEAQWRKEERRVATVAARASELYQCPWDPTAPSFKFPGSGSRAAMCIPGSQREIFDVLTDVVAQMRGELLGNYQNDLRCPPEPELD